MIFDAVVDIIIDAGIDTLKIIPFLFLAFLVMEYIESAANRGSVRVLTRTRFFGPFWGAAAGIIPQCGFSASASGLYSGGVITLGTLMAVYLSTSDEMIPIFFSAHVPLSTLMPILLLKGLIGMVSGFLIDAFMMKLHRRHDRKKSIHDLCEHDHCHCENDGGILVPAMRHTVQIAAYIFLASAVITAVINLIGQQRLGALLQDIPVIGIFLSCLIGLIPNCAASVIITQMFLEGLIGTAQMMSGLLVGAGVGILVLFRSNDNLLENIRILALLYGLGVIWGLIIQFSGLSFAV